MQKFPWYWPKWQHDLWAEQRVHGRKGMLRYSLPWTLIMLVAMGGTTLWAKSNRGEHVTFEDVLIQMSIWILGGILYGVGSWYFGEKLYAKYSSEKLEEFEKQA